MGYLEIDAVGHVIGGERVKPAYDYDQLFRVWQRMAQELTDADLKYYRELYVEWVAKGDHRLQCDRMVLNALEGEAAQKHRQSGKRYGSPKR